MEISLRLTKIKTPERRRFGVYTDNYFTHCFSVSIADFEQINTNSKGSDIFGRCHNKFRRILDSTKICSEVPFKKTLYHIETSQLSIDLLCKYGFCVIQVFTETHFRID